VATTSAAEISSAVWSSFTRPRWMDRAACRGAPLELFFPPRGRPTYYEKVPAEAAALCRTCPVREECWDHALSLPACVQGVYAGHSHRERLAMLRKARAS
jgi:WhiB family transcriptional regulator, redox-sensing transcriptional regulator